MKGKYHLPQSSLYYNVIKVYHVSDKGYMKIKLSVHYKSNDNFCEWFTRDRAKNFKLLTSAVNLWVPYSK